MEGIAGDEKCVVQVEKRLKGRQTYNGAVRGVALIINARGSSGCSEIGVGSLVTDVELSHSKGHGCTTFS